MRLFSKMKVESNIKAMAKFIYKAGVPTDAEILRTSVPYTELLDEALDEMERRGLLTVKPGRVRI